MVVLLQVLGHFAAKLDPLKLDVRTPPHELDPVFWGFKDTDLDRECVRGLFLSCQTRPQAGASSRARA